MSHEQPGRGDVLFRDVEVDGVRRDVLVRAGHVQELGPPGVLGELGASVSTEVVDGRGGALIPGLHDHHVHLNALAAVRRSVDVGPESAPDLETLGEALRAGVGPTGWARAVGHHESSTGPLDRDVLDAVTGEIPVRVQHRSGALWVLNSAALDRVAGVLDDSDDVERDAAGRPTGRLWRYDQRLQSALPSEADEHADALRAVTRELLSLGITGVTDATPDLADSALAALEATAPLKIHLLGRQTGSPLPSRMSHGPRKVLLRDHDLPDYDDLLALLAACVTADGERRPVAVHCVSRDSLVLTLAALDELGVVPGDRIEHGAVVPDELASWLARLGLPVVTQPDFLRVRGEQYLREVDQEDLPHLYRVYGLLDAGVQVACSSDAPFGSVDPWQVLRSAVARRTWAGNTLGVAEQVDAGTALRGYLSDARSPGGPLRRVAPGAVADLVLLDVGLDEALRHPDPGHVRATWVDGVTAPVAR